MPAWCRPGWCWGGASWTGRRGWRWRRRQRQRRGGTRRCGWRSRVPGPGWWIWRGGGWWWRGRWRRGGWGGGWGWTGRRCWRPPPAAIQVRGPLRILAVIASPDTGGGELLDYEAELAAIIGATDP